MNTVFTPEALRRSKSFKCTTLKNYLTDRNLDADEAFLFIFPSPDIFNEANGDGDLLEIHDFAQDMSEVYTSRGKHKTTPTTDIWYR